MTKEIVIAGFGFVGKAVFNLLKPYTRCLIVDPQYNENTIDTTMQIDGVIICVGTPSLPNGDCDDSQIRDVMSKLSANIPVLIKSTITPDKLERLTLDYPDNPICYSPEFLRANTADSDFANQKYVILGGDDSDGVWEDLLRTALPQCNLYLKCTLTEAATVKYSVNSFLATKVAFFNHIYDLCQSNGANYDIVRQLITHDERITLSHTLVPGPDDDRGFGGHCFPKDTAALVHYADTKGVSLDVLKTAIKYNKTVRKTLDL